MMRAVLVGAGMGLMMLAMVHMALTGDSGMGAAALLVFVAGHALVVALALLGGVCAMRVSPAWRARLARLHRPSLRHATAMLSGVGLASGLVHLALHGGAA